MQVREDEDEGGIQERVRVWEPLGGARTRRLVGV